MADAWLLAIALCNRIFMPDVAKAQVANIAQQGLNQNGA